MADSKITALTNLAGSSLAAGDELVVEDADGSETKAITIQELANGLATAIATALTGSGAAAADELLVFDGGAGGTAKTITIPETAAALFAAVTTTMLGSEVTEGTDEVLVSDGGVAKTMTIQELASAIVLATFTLGDIPEYADQATAAAALSPGQLFRFTTTGALGIALT